MGKCHKPEQGRSAPAEKTASPRTSKLLFLLTSASPKQKKTERKQSKKNLILKLQSWQRAFPIGGVMISIKGFHSLTVRSFAHHTQIITKCRSGPAQSQQLICFPLTFNLSDCGRINPLGSASFPSPSHHCQYLITPLRRT